MDLVNKRYNDILGRLNAGDVQYLDENFERLGKRNLICLAKEIHGILTKYWSPEVVRERMKDYLMESPAFCPKEGSKYNRNLTLAVIPGAGHFLLRQKRLKDVVDCQIFLLHQLQAELEESRREKSLSRAVLVQEDSLKRGINVN